MYDHEDDVDTEVSLDTVADGNYVVRLPRGFRYTELSFLRFVNAAGAVVTPSAGSVKFQVSADGSTWITADGGDFPAATPPVFPSFYSGSIKAARLVLTGVTGATGVRASIMRGNGPEQAFRDMVTSSARGFRRLRVDIAQTSFFEGREFRTFKELSIANGASYIVRILVPLDIIFHSFNISIESGTIRVASVGGTPTPTGTFTETLPIIAKNKMSTVKQPVYQPQVVMTAGATALTGGTEIDVVRAAAGGGQSSTVQAVGESDDTERGIAVGTYYFKFQNVGSGTVVGVFKAHWEERP